MNDFRGGLTDVSAERNHCAGYCGMPDLKIRPCKTSMHGRQKAIDYNGTVLFSIAKIPRMFTLHIRHNLEICLGGTSDMVRYKPNHRCRSLHCTPVLLF